MIKSKKQNGSTLRQCVIKIDKPLFNILPQSPSENNMCETTTGCGQGDLIQRTIARDVHIDYKYGLLGKGRFGTVWRGEWQSDQVAVKIFFSMHEASWTRESEIYQTCMFRHENLLGYIASDIFGQASSVSMLLITEYHPLGSLFDFLQMNSVDKKLILKFSYSVINGLNHLHKEIFSRSYKPSIVHRDLKTKNILIKINMDCCIADFGLAVRYNSQLNKFDTWSDNSFSREFNTRVGSVRYMAPECLNGTVNANSIEDLKKTDLYSYGLLVWELISRLRLDKDDTISEHVPPYSEYVSGNPSIEAMSVIVCEKLIRPKTRFDQRPCNQLENVNI